MLSWLHSKTIWCSNQFKRLLKILNYFRAPDNFCHQVGKNHVRLYSTCTDFFTEFQRRLLTAGSLLSYTSLGKDHTQGSVV